MADNDVNFDLHLGTLQEQFCCQVICKTANEIYYNSERPENKSAFKRFSDFLKGGDFLDLDLLFEIGEEIQPLDIEQIFSNPKKEFYATLSNVDSGQLEVNKPTKKT